MATLASFNSLIQGRVRQLPDEIQSKILLYASMHPCAKILREALQPLWIKYNTSPTANWIYIPRVAHIRPRIHNRYIGNVYWIDYIHSPAYPKRWDCCYYCLFRYHLNPFIDTGSSICPCCLFNYYNKPTYTTTTWISNNFNKIIRMKQRDQKNQNKALKKQQMRYQRTNNRKKTNRSFK